MALAAPDRVKSPEGVYRGWRDPPGPEPQMECLSENLARDTDRDGARAFLTGPSRQAVRKGEAASPWREGSNCFENSTRGYQPRSVI